MKTYLTDHPRCEALLLHMGDIKSAVITHEIHKISLWVPVPCSREEATMTTVTLMGTRYLKHTLACVVDRSGSQVIVDVSEDCPKSLLLFLDPVDNLPFDAW